MAGAKVAIGVPVFNGEQWLSHSLDSLLSQTYGNFIILISDNASTDNTAEICRKYCELDGRVRYVRNDKNLGAFRNYDLAFSRTESEYFKWCAVGDACDPAFIERAVAILDANPDCVLVHARTSLTGDVVQDPSRYLTDLHLVDDQPANRYRYFLEHVRLNNVMNGLIRSEPLRRTCLNRQFPSSDVCMIAELALIGKFYQLPEELLYRRMDPRTATALRSAKEMDEFFIGDSRGIRKMAEWKQQATLLSGIWRSGIPVRDKVSLTLYRGRRLMWRRSTLIRELVAYLKPGNYG